MEIPIFLCYENFFLQDKSKQIRDPKNYTILGEYIYWPSQQKPVFSAKLYEKALKEEFNISKDLDKYMFYYWFGVVKDSDRQRYIIVETISLYKDSGIKNMLNINRSQFAMSLSGITKHIRHFAIAQDIRNIEARLADEIKNDEDILSFLD